MQAALRPPTVPSLEEAGRKIEAAVYHVDYE